MSDKRVVAYGIRFTIYTTVALFCTALFGFNTLCGCAGDDSYAEVAKTQFKKFDNALVAYKLKFGTYPDTLDGLVSPPSGESLLTYGSIPTDPWGNAYGYTIYGTGDQREYVISSLGADGVVGGDDEDADILSDDVGN